MSFGNHQEARPHYVISPTGVDQRRVIVRCVCPLSMRTNPIASVWYPPKAIYVCGHCRYIGRTDSMPHNDAVTTSPVGTRSPMNRSMAQAAAQTLMVLLGGVRGHHGPVDDGHRDTEANDDEVHASKRCKQTPRSGGGHFVDMTPPPSTPSPNSVVVAEPTVTPVDPNPCPSSSQLSEDCPSLYPDEMYHLYDVSTRRSADTQLESQMPLPQPSMKREESVVVPLSPESPILVGSKVEHVVQGMYQATGIVKEINYHRGGQLTVDFGESGLGTKIVLKRECRVVNAA